MTTENNKPLWERLVEIGQQVPQSEHKKIPTDLSRNVDHYLYGAPKEEDEPIEVEYGAKTQTMINPVIPRLFTKAVAYLTTHGFVDCDFSNYYPDGEGFEKCGCIGLSFHPDTVYIEVRDSLCANSSPNMITLTTEQEHLLEPILDVLMFAVKLGEEK